MAWTKSNRTVGALDFAVSRAIASLNDSLRFAHWWNSLVKGYTYTLNLSGSDDVWAGIYPAEWPKTSHIGIRLTKRNTGGWMVREGTISAPHIKFARGIELTTSFTVDDFVDGGLEFTPREQTLAGRILAHAIAESRR